MKKTPVPKVLKCMVWEEYIGREFEGHCYCCSSNIDVFHFHAGHVEPASKGGNMSLENLRPVCASCNLSMSNKNMIDFINQHNMSGKVNFKEKYVRIGNKIYATS